MRQEKKRKEKKRQKEIDKLNCKERNRTLIDDE
jgi:hypothetical protein